MGLSVSQLASKLGFTNEQIVDVMLENGIMLTSPQAELPKETEKKIWSKLQNKKKLNKYHINSSSLEYIEINGLFNKYNYIINFEKDINILVAENGAGKTTILNIIIATLKGDIHKLKRLPFKSISVKVKGNKYTIKKSSLNESSLYNNIYDEKVEVLLRRLRSILPDMLYKRLRSSIVHNRYSDLDRLEFNIRDLLMRDNIYAYPYKEYIYEVLCMIKDIKHISKHKRFDDNSKENIKKISNILEESLLYFPTYRRIEDQLDNIIQLNDSQVNEFTLKFKNSTLNFGISDVELTLKNLFQKLKDDANEYYTKMTAEILNDLLNDKIELSKVQEKKIDKEKIEIVIGRIGEEKINDLDKLRSFIYKNSEVPYSEFLKYYIYKLINIYEAQKAIDDKIKKFRDVCNKYLVNKEMIYNEVIADIQIVDKDTLKPISFNYLSSGEKQILSLFSRLYLDITRSSIFIIDEPELSLSIIWQKQLLEDIYDCGNISLLIATTHSPFIFKNRFREFAKDLDFYKVEGKNE
ncbi:AAA family ATPase [Clostridium novyi]